MRNPAFYQKLFKLLPTPILVILPDFPKYTVVDINDAFLNFSNVSASTLAGNSFLSALEQNKGLLEYNWDGAFKKVLEDKLPLLQIIATSSKGNQSNDYELELTPLVTGKDIENIIVTIKPLPRSRPLPDPKHIIRPDSMTDLETLRKAERIAKVASWELNLEASIVSWSEMGKSIDEMDSFGQSTLNSALNFFEEIESRERIENAIKEAALDGTSFELDLQLTTSKADSPWVRVIGKTDFKDGKCVRIYGLLQDISRIKEVEYELQRSKNQLDSLVQSVEGIAWEADLEIANPTFVSDKLYRLTGFAPERWKDHLSFLMDQVHPDDKGKVQGFYHSLDEGSGNGTLEYRLIKANGDILCIIDNVAVVYQKGLPRYLRGTMMDVTISRRNAELENLEKRVLESNAQKDVSLQEILKQYFIGVESLFPHITCSLYQARDNYLYNWASPSLPQDLIDQVGAVPIAERSMSCGTAAFRKEPVIVRDIATDPLWENYSRLMLSYGFKACWSFPVLDSKGKVLASLGIYFKEIKGPEEEIVKVIEKSMSLFKLILENRQSLKLIQDNAILMKQGQELARLGNWRWDIHSNEVQWSDSLYTIYGLDKNSFKTTFDNYMKLVHPDDQERVRKKLNQAITTKQETEFEERVLHSDGGVRILKSWCKVILDENREVVEMVGACLDVSESKSVQRRLAKSQVLLSSVVKELRINIERYKLANKATNEAIYEVNLEKQTLHWGEGFYRIFGYKEPPYYLPSDYAISLIHPSETARIGEEFKKFLDDPSRSQWNPQYRFLKADQSYSYVEENGYAIRDKEGKVIRIIGALRDISTLKQDERKMNQLHQELERNLRIMAISNAELAQFAHTISHDLLEPLRMITGFLGQLEKKYAELLDEKGKQYVFYAVDGAKRMRQIILDLLNFSKVGQLDEEKEQVDLNTLIQEILILYRRKIKDKQASFKIVELPTIYTVKSPVRLVFQNLISNALAFQREGIPPFIEISFEETESLWQFTVADNGTGIEEAFFDRVFILFDRLQPSENVSGTGIGLAVSKKIIESLGGNIWITSEKGKGSKFHFTLAKTNAG